jgi:hypothetical protein
MAQSLSKSIKTLSLLPGNVGFISSRTLTSRAAESYYDSDQKSMQQTLLKIIDNDINPNVDQWEKEGHYPAHQVYFLSIWQVALSKK